MNNTECILCGAEIKQLLSLNSQTDSWVTQSTPHSETEYLKNRVTKLEKEIITIYNNMRQ